MWRRKRTNAFFSLIVNISLSDELQRVSRGLLDAEVVVDTDRKLAAPPSGGCEKRHTLDLSARAA